jgi:hypothetical protein
MIQQKKEYTNCHEEDTGSKTDALYKCVDINEETHEEGNGNGKNSITVTISYIYKTNTFPTAELFEMLKRQERDGRPVIELLDTLATSVTVNKAQLKKWEDEK